MAAKRKAKSQEFIDDSDDPEDTGAKSEKAKKKTKSFARESDIQDNELIALSPKRFINVKSFKGKLYVDIREYYEDDSGESRPGKKGISLTLDQWEKLKESIDTVDEKIHST